MARTVSDVAFLDETITGDAVPGADIKGARIGVPRPDFWDKGLVEPGVARVILAAFEKLRQAGAELIEIDLPILLDQIASRRLAAAVFLPNTKTFLDWHRENAPEISLEDIQSYRRECGLRDIDFEFLTSAPRLSSSEAQQVTLEASRAHRALFESNDIAALAFPILPMTAPLINPNGDTPGQHVRMNDEWVHELIGNTTFTRASPTLGSPGLCLPAGLSGGLPVGLELETLPGDDSKLLGLGIAVENVLGRLPSPPPLRD